MAEGDWLELPWDRVVDRVSPLVFRIYVGQSAGTGFVISRSATRFDGRHGTIVATALHVLADAASTGAELRLVSADRSKSFSSSRDEIRVQELGYAIHDTAMLLVLSEEPLIEQGAINGVSGGPAFDNRAHLIGLVSAYIPNRLNESILLPGLTALVPINALRMFLQEFMKAKAL